ncbi:MAG: ImmA/IrrE family metallo-endopeptidase, partial [Chloroflexota bacterium]|nr:ImmA/IrrE family metallo-endopeptidase [Chloroflexota bacterium]
MASGFGLVVVTWPFRVLQEMQAGGVIAVARRLDPPWRRWVIAHAIGHHLLHPGNHLRMRRQGLLDDAVEREAEEFAGALLVDGREAIGAGITGPRDVARHFGVPEEMVRLH